MTLVEFLKANRTELDEAIHRLVPGYQLNNEERRQWILNDESLYLWARAEGVNI